MKKYLALGFLVMGLAIPGLNALEVTYKTIEVLGTGGAREGGDSVGANKRSANGDWNEHLCFLELARACLLMKKEREPTSKLSLTSVKKQPV